MASPTAFSDHLQEGPMPDVHLRLIEPGDYEQLFRFQADPAAIQMAAFTSADPADRVEFDGHLDRIRTDKSVVPRTILHENDVVGTISAWDTGRIPQIGYSIDPARWGQGLATGALLVFTTMMKRRPLQARVAADNRASIRVLEKAGFARVATERSFANARQTEIDEHLYELGFFPAATYLGITAS